MKALKSTSIEFKTMYAFDFNKPGKNNVVVLQ